MKRNFISLFVCLFIAAVASAEEMKFITMLSQPVGIFQRVDLLDADKQSNISTLSFCQTSSNCQISADQVKMTQLTLETDGLLSATSNVPTFYVRNITLQGLEKKASDTSSLTANSLTLNGSFSNTSKVKILIGSDFTSSSGSKLGRIGSLSRNQTFTYSKDLSTRVASFNNMSMDGSNGKAVFAASTSATLPTGRIGKRPLNISTHTDSLNWFSIACAEDETTTCKLSGNAQQQKAAKARLLYGN